MSKFTDLTNVQFFFKFIFFSTYVALVVVLSVYLAYLLIVFVASILLIKSINRRDDSKMILFLVITAIGVFLSFLQILTVGLSGVGIALITAGIEAYFFLCIYSLYNKFRSDRTGIHGPIQMEPHLTPGQVYHYTQQPVIYAQQPVAHSQQPATYAHDDEPPMTYEQATQPYSVRTFR